MKSYHFIAIITGITAITLGSRAEAVVTAGTSTGVGIDVGVTTLSLLELSVGPLAETSGSAPASYSVSDNVADVSVSTAVGSVVATDDGDGAINTLASSNVDAAPGIRSATGSSTVNEAGVILIPLLTDLLNISSTTLGSTSTTTGDHGALSSTGSAVIENLDVSVAGTDLLLGVNSAAPNTVYVDAGGIIGLTITLNEQIPTGDGITSSGITTNALHVNLDGVSFGTFSGVSGDVIIGQSSSALTAVPEPSSALLGSLMILWWLPRRRR